LGWFAKCVETEDDWCWSLVAIEMFLRGGR
jgi:hypothetical protein